MEVRKGGRVSLEMQRKGVGVVVMGGPGPPGRSEEECEAHRNYEEKCEDKTYDLPFHRPCSTCVCSPCLPSPSPDQGKQAGSASHCPNLVSLGKSAGVQDASVGELTLLSPRSRHGQ